MDSLRVNGIGKAKILHQSKISQRPVFCLEDDVAFFLIGRDANGVWDLHSQEVGGLQGLFVLTVGPSVGEREEDLLVRRGQGWIGELLKVTEVLNEGCNDVNVGDSVPYLLFWISEDVSQHKFEDWLQDCHDSVSWEMILYETPFKSALT